MNIAKKKNLFRARYLVLIYTSIEAHCRIFVTGGSFFATKSHNVGQKEALYLLTQNIWGVYFTTRDHKTSRCATCAAIGEATVAVSAVALAIGAGGAVIADAGVAIADVAVAGRIRRNGSHAQSLAAL